MAQQILFQWINKHLNQESWAPKNWCFWTVVLEKTLESPLDCKEIQPVHPKGDQSWVFIGGTDVEADTLATWCKEWTHWKRPWCWERLKAGRDGQGQQRVRWLDGITDSMDMSLSQLWDSEGHGSLACCSPWGCKESDMTEQLNNNSSVLEPIITGSWKQTALSKSVFNDVTLIVWNWPRYFLHWN